MSLEDDIRSLAERQRAYASFRTGGTKEQVELGAVTDLIESMQARGMPRYKNPQSLLRDPPDCTATTLDGKPVAIEVTEFVSEAAVAMNEAARPGRAQLSTLERLVMARWDEQTFFAHLASVLTTKDQKTLIGGPYAEYVVLAHTDEPLLVRSTVETWLSNHTFGPYHQVTSAYFQFSYEPGHSYPFIELALTGA
jgi:hypothetical protein